MISLPPYDLSIELARGKIQCSTVIWNASGVYCTEMDQLQSLAGCENIGGIVTKSCTLQPRDGNPYPRYHSVSHQSINSMGLPNRGLRYYLEASRTLSHSKPTVISLCGLTREENVDMVRRIFDFGTDTVAGIELNLSCPNVPGKPQTGYDFEAMDETLRRVTEVHGTSCPMGIKLPPYFDPVHFGFASDVVKKYDSSIDWVTCINSIGNGLVIDPLTETTCIAPKNGLGGIGGSPVKPTALANVNSFRRLLPDSIDIIGCGGIIRGFDAFEHILCGATAVQVGTQLQDYGLTALQKIRSELEFVMSSKGYTKLADFRGKLKVQSPVTELPANDPSKIRVKK